MTLKTTRPIDKLIIHCSATPPTMDIEGFPQYKVFFDGRIFSQKTGRFLKNSRDKNGYAVVNLSSDSGKRQKVYVHRIVGKHFISNPENKPQIAHKDGNGMNAHVGNLRWSTQAENEKDKISHGRYNKNPYGRQIFGKEELDKIIELSLSGLSFRKIGRMMNTSHSVISSIVNKMSYKNYDLSTQ